MSESRSFVRLFVGFLLSATGIHASCPIEVSPPAVVVKYGDSVSVNCSTMESQLKGIGWEATEGGIGLQPVSHLTWTVKNLTKWNISPKCFFTPPLHSPHKQCLREAKVVLYTFPETISMSSSIGDSGRMMENEACNLTCVIHNIAPVQNLTVRWYKEDKIIRTEPFEAASREPMNPSSVFSFRPTRQDDGTTFRCEAHLDLRPEGPQFNVSSKEYKITVLFGPDIGCDAPMLLEGETLEKHCPVTGYPTPFVKWEKDGQPIDPSKPLSRKDTWKYSVEAEGASSAKKTLQVIVMYEPKLTCTSNYTVEEHTPHNLPCTVDGYPEPEVIWYKDGEEVELPDKLTRRDTGQYVITASNTVSNVSVAVDIIVSYAPSQIEVEVEDSEVDVGSTTWLQCSSTGNPRPQYSWNYYRTDNVNEKSEDGVSRLIIHGATAHNTGSYTCHAWNNKGNVSKTVRVTVKGTKQECPLELTPDRMVIPYQSRSQNATCKPTSTGSRNIEGEVYWNGTKTRGASWSVDTHKDWEARPVCTATFKGIGPCQKKLDFTLYKTPDSVSIRSVDPLKLLVEKEELQLHCDIANVAPARNLVVRWYLGNETFEPPVKGSMRLTGCLPEKTLCHINAISSPLNVSSTISITLNRTYSGAEFRCEAHLDFGPDGPQLPPISTSDPLNITVYYKPIINTTKLPKAIPVFRGYPEELVCEADGHPPPKIQWLYDPDKVPHLSGNTLTVFEAGFYNCSATNEVGSISHTVKVVLKEDYLPLIAGFVAVTVVVISVIFLFIFSIYYKNTRMRRYSLKNPKLSTHNGNVAHNGWDLQFPMTKLS